METSLELLHLTLGDTGLQGALAVPLHARGLVVLIDGSVIGRASARQRTVAGYFLRNHHAVMMANLLQQPDAEVDIDPASLLPALCDQLADILRFARGRPELAGLPTGIHADDLAGAAALRTAAAHPDLVAALVLRAARLDMAWAELERVQAPTLLVVPGLDVEAIALARDADRHLRGPHRIEVVSRATRRFEEASALERACLAACDWFGQHLRQDER